MKLSSEFSGSVKASTVNDSHMVPFFLFACAGSIDLLFGHSSIDVSFNDVS